MQIRKEINANVFKFNYYPYDNEREKDYETFIFDVMPEQKVKYIISAKSKY